MTESAPANRWANRRELVAKVIELRLAGHTYEEIGRMLGISSNRALRIARRELGRAMREPVDLLLQLELDRLDALMRAYWDAAVSGDGEAADRVLRIMDRRARYLGLDRQEAIQEDIGRAVLTLVRKLQELGAQPTSAALPEPVDATYEIVVDSHDGAAEQAETGTRADEGTGTDG